MGPASETYRGAAAPWECDVTEHFTLAFYFDRVAMAEALLAAELGLGELLREGGFARCYDVRLARELNAGSAFQIESGLIGLDGGLRFGHRVVDATTGDTVTWCDVHWEAEVAGLPVSRLTAWEGSQFAPRAEPTDLARLTPTAAGRVQPGDLDEFGRMGLCWMAHKFSHSAVQTISAVGLTARYIETDRRSYSTFELRLRIAGSPGLGDRYQIRSGITHLGNSSLHFAHMMSDAASGREIARVGQYGVQLDLDARRPAPLAAELRERAQRLLLPQA